MQRILHAPRANWQKIVEEQGLTFWESDGQLYWDESAYYRFSSGELDALESATQELDALCLQAVEHVISRGDWERFGVPEPLRAWVERSWEVERRTIVGRFDLWFDGREIKLLEYNADTPTGLIEAAVAQWFWLKDCFVDEADQFNSIHENLLDAWAQLKIRTAGDVLHFTGIDDGGEDYMTANYLLDTAAQSGWSTKYLPIENLGWNAPLNSFVDEEERAIELIWKLYPWEWLRREGFGRHLANARTRWLEAPWKMLLSNKAILVVLWELFPDHPLLLRAEMEPWSDSYARKPLLGREGANVSLVENGRELAVAGGLYGAGCLYQELKPLPEFDGNFPVCGSWMVNGVACGLGIREDRGLISGDNSRFVPHLLATDDTDKVTDKHR